MTPPGGATYKDILDLDDPQLDAAAKRGRRLLKANDLIMSASTGPEHSIYNSSVTAVLEVVMVNIGYGLAQQDWTKISIALAALEVALEQTADNGGNLPPEEATSLCATICHHLRNRIDDLPEQQRNEALEALDTLVKYAIS